MRGKISMIVWAAAAVLLTLSLVWYPESALGAAKDGMTLFLNVVFPSLLPFFILSEIMLGLVWALTLSEPVRLTLSEPTWARACLQ